MLRLAVVALSLVGVTACRNSSVPEQDRRLVAAPLQPGIAQDPPSVEFDIKPTISLPNAGDLYDCTFRAGNKTAKFRLQIQQNGPMKGPIPMAAAEGKFLSVDGSDNSVLLEDLKKALDAKHIPSQSARIPELPFDAVVLGERQSRSPTGGYSDQPHGDWMTVKIFFPKGGDDGEFFLNLNPVLGKAEISLKDSDYGDYLLAQLARVL